MTGFNINCIDCENCYRIEEYHSTILTGCCYFCVITSDTVDIENNIDCCDYVYVKRRKNELEILH